MAAAIEALGYGYSPWNRGYYGTLPIDPCRPHDYLHAHKGCRRILHPLTPAEVLAYCFHDTKLNIELKQINKLKLLPYSPFY